MKNINRQKFMAGKSISAPIGIILDVGDYKIKTYSKNINKKYMYFTNIYFGKIYITKNEKTYYACVAMHGPFPPLGVDFDSVAGKYIKKDVKNIMSQSFLAFLASQTKNKDTSEWLEKQQYPLVKRKYIHIGNFDDMTEILKNLKSKKYLKIQKKHELKIGDF